MRNIWSKLIHTHTHGHTHAHTHTHTNMNTLDTLAHTQTSSIIVLIICLLFYVFLVQIHLNCKDIHMVSHTHWSTQPPITTNSRLITQGVTQTDTFSNTVTLAQTHTKTFWKMVSGPQHVDLVTSWPEDQGFSGSLICLGPGVCLLLPAAPQTVGVCMCNSARESVHLTACIWECIRQDRYSPDWL